MSEIQVQANESSVKTIIGTFESLDTHSITVGDVLSTDYKIRHDQLNGNKVTAIILQHRMSQIGKKPETRYRDMSVIKAAKIYFEDGEPLYLLAEIDGYFL